jgi:dethiobiotin synthetase
MRLLITGTDTEVGKTVVTAALAAAIPGVSALKPLASGSAPPGEDALMLARAAGMHLDWPGLLNWIRGFEAPVLVEGVGGFAVPLDRHHRVSDLAVALGYPVLIVAANRLGVISHTLLTVEAILSRGLPLAGVVLNTVPGGATPPLSHWNLSDLRREVPGPVVSFPTVHTDAERLAAGRALLDALSLSHHRSG